MMKKLFDDLQASWEQRNWKKLVGTIALLGVVAGVLIWLGVKLVSFVAVRFEIIMLIVGGYASLWYWLSTKRADKQKKLAEQQAQESEAAEQLKRLRAEKNYAIIAETLFTILLHTSNVLQLHQPDSPQRLHSPGRILTGDTFVKYRYQVLKNTPTVDVRLIQEVLQKEIDSRVATKEIGLSNGSYSYHGNLYSIYQVVAVQEIGNYCNIDLAIADDVVCAYLENCAYIELERQESILHMEDNTF